MKKAVKVIVVIGVVIAVLVVAAGAFMNSQVEKAYNRLDQIPAVELSDVKDGTYEGSEDADIVKVTVSVTVESHKISEIQLIRHENGMGTPAESMIDEMIRRDTSEVDEVSGATMSSKVIRAAVRNALAQGIE